MLIMLRQGQSAVFHAPHPARQAQHIPLAKSSLPHPITGHGQFGKGAMVRGLPVHIRCLVGHWRRCICVHKSPRQIFLILKGHPNLPPFQHGTSVTSQFSSFMFSGTRKAYSICREPAKELWVLGKHAACSFSPAHPRPIVAL